MRTQAGLSQEQAAKNVDQTKQSWQNYEKGSVQAILRVDLQRRLAGALGGTRDDLIRLKEQIEGSGSNIEKFEHLLTGRIAPSEKLPICDIVQAGSWVSAEADDQDRSRYYLMSPDPRYSFADQWLCEVIGDSADKLNFCPGDLIHCVDAAQINYHARTGDIVEVERLRFEGSERELTFKQVEVRANGVFLWPRSTNSRWSAPLQLHSGEAPSDIVVKIRGLVLAQVRRFSI